MIHEPKPSQWDKQIMKELCAMLKSANSGATVPNAEKSSTNTPSTASETKEAWDLFYAALGASK